MLRKDAPNDFITLLGLIALALIVGAGAGWFYRWFVALFPITH
jgi:hypothetical protein